MSGGSMNYVYSRIADAAEDVKDKEIQELMYDLADLMHDLEWWESGDYGEEDYLETLTKFKGKWFGSSRNVRLQKYIDETCVEFANQLKNLLTNVEA